MNNNIKIIGICGPIRVGKDTFAALYKKLYGQDIKSPSAFRRNTIEIDSFANQLKNDLFDLCHQKFGWNIYNITGKDKETFRPIMIAYGCAQRTIDSNYWVKVVDDRYISRTHDYTLIIPDFRYFNEYLYFKSKYGNSFALVEIARQGAPEPPQEEKINLPMLQNVANYKIDWKTVGDDKLSELEPHIQDCYNALFNRE